MSAAAERAQAIDPLDAIDAIVGAHRWATPDTLQRLRSQHGAGDAASYLRLLGTSHVLDSEKRAQLDQVQMQQNVLPAFQLLKKLGAGGMGTVWLARMAGVDEPLALKVINARLAVDADFLGRFHRETKALAGLRHPHIAAVIDSGGVQDTHYLAMEYINGPNLGEMLKTHKAIPEAYVLRIIHQIAEGLAYVNGTCGLVHRDIKPENILVKRLDDAAMFPEDDIAKLIDFGLVKNANDDEHLTQTGMTIGTPLYMSPEQVRGEKLDGRSDIYALGATMYHLLTGTAPFKGSSPGAIMSAHLTEPVPDPGDLVPSLSDATRRLVTMAMAKNVDDRFRGFDALVRAIDEAEQAAHEKGGGMKLLRKPLVIAKKPAATKKPGTGPHDGSHPSGERPAAELTERIARKHSESQRESGRLQKSSGRFQVAKEHGAPAPLQALTERQVRPAPPAAITATASLEDSVNLRPSDAVAVTNALTKPHDPPRSRPGSSVAAAAHPTPAPHPSPLATPPSDPHKRSAVYDVDPTTATGFGIVPWTILALAILATLGFAAFQLLW
ncbi:MAG TPA: serine/threonine-protein kinase [Planctomycetota bacterium]|nr:serine/threonine-protein kinase [Planctomycetota bacterium]